MNEIIVIFVIIISLKLRNASIKSLCAKKNKKKRIFFPFDEQTQTQDGIPDGILPSIMLAFPCRLDSLEKSGDNFIPEAAGQGNFLYIARFREKYRD